MRSRRRCQLAACLLLAGPLLTGDTLAGTPTGCTRIADVPVVYAMTYGAAVQGVFDNYAASGTAGCVDCHFTPPPDPAGPLDLEPGVSWAHLVNVASPNDPAQIYVVPGRPEQSLLFRKINCDTPGLGARMPLGGFGGGLSVDQQALIYDWIAAGALPGTSEGLFRNGFDMRGFVP